MDVKSAKTNRPATATTEPQADYGTAQEREDSELASDRKPEAQSSRLPGFYELPRSERLRAVQSFSRLGDGDIDALGHAGNLRGELIDVFIENGVGTFGLPLGIATNFKVNGRDVLVPMAVEETSVLAAASHGAKLARAGGGFNASSTAPVMTGQIQLMLQHECDYDAVLQERKQQLIEYANRGQDRLLARGGGAVDLTWHFIPEIRSLVLHLHINTCDAMGANIVNTMAERVSTLMPELLPVDIGLRILTNLTDRRMTEVSCRVPKAALTTAEFEGARVAARIVMAYQFAAHDVHRAATNNKGIMNGIDPVVIATGNDWRAVEAGAHAYASLSGRYLPMAKWSLDDAGDLIGQLKLPLAVGVVGGVTRLHPSAQAALSLLGQPDAQELANIIAAVGLAQNLSALRALASEGIQRGHMSLHRSNLDLLDRRGASKE
ncbi:MAG: hydroxymethylglutaryl-CoA reductase, degradative [Deltaproteobacteria bacterium]|nr:hydroxymethylglutaryl-CoA reductase, degradative [Deltaproteobacteria bacterium]